MQVFKVFLFYIKDIQYYFLFLKIENTKYIQKDTKYVLFVQDSLIFIHKLCYFLFLKKKIGEEYPNKTLIMQNITKTKEK